MTHNYVLTYSFLKAPGADPETSHLRHTFLQTARLVEARVKPIFVFDGAVRFEPMEL
jgi:hypothetical protein